MMEGERGMRRKEGEGGRRAGEVRRDKQGMEGKGKGEDGREWAKMVYIAPESQKLRLVHTTYLDHEPFFLKGGTHAVDDVILVA